MAGVEGSGCSGDDRGAGCSLLEAAAGEEWEVEGLVGDAAACRQLREIGFCEEMRLRKLTNGRNLLCAVCGTRLALNRRLAEKVRVRRVRGEGLANE